MKHENGSAYIYVIIMFMISSLLLNSALGIIKINDEKKHSENNNLYYMAQFGADKFLDMLNQILNLSLKQTKQSEKSEIEIFNTNEQKFLGTQNKIEIEIKNAPRDYKIQINFERESDFTYSIESCAQDTKNNNKIKIVCKYKRDGQIFSVISYKLF